MLRLKTFGGLAIRRNGAPVEGAGAQRRRLALLALLAEAGERGMSRERLLGLLWPDSDLERGRKNLAQAVYALRRDLGADELITGTADLRLNTDHISSDLHDFRRAAAEGGWRMPWRSTRTLPRRGLSRRGAGVRSLGGAGTERPGARVRCGAGTTRQARHPGRRPSHRRGPLAQARQRRPAQRPGGRRPHAGPRRRRRPRRRAAALPRVRDAAAAGTRDRAGPEAQGAGGRLKESAGHPGQGCAAAAGHPVRGGSWGDSRTNTASRLRPRSRGG